MSEEERREYNKEYYEANKKKLKEKAKEYREANKEKINDKKREYNKQYREVNKEIIKERSKEYYKANQEKAKEYYEANQENLKEYSKEYSKANKEKVKEYYKENKDKINKSSKEYQKNRKLSDPLFKMKCNLRDRTYKAFKTKGYRKNTKTQEMLGVDWEVCKAHIERQFTKGMNWKSHGEWHIDHIIPLASAKNEKELRKLCHYRNLQPLWAVDNLSKSDKIIGQQSFMRI